MFGVLMSSFVYSFFFTDLDAFLSPPILVLSATTITNNNHLSVALSGCPAADRSGDWFDLWHRASERCSVTMCRRLAGYTYHTPKSTHTRREREKHTDTAFHPPH